MEKGNVISKRIDRIEEIILGYVAKQRYYNSKEEDYVEIEEAIKMSRR